MNGAAAGHPKRDQPADSMAFSNEVDAGSR
jgi:hypothetical protein